jgi:ribosomal protein L15
LNIDKVIYYLKRKALESTPERFITVKDLYKCGAIDYPKYGVKLLSKGKSIINTCQPIFIEVPQASDSVIKAIQEAGGQVRRFICLFKI